MNSKMVKLILPSSCKKIAVCGGPYNNFEAVETFLKETADFEYRFCLGDMGGFGPYPDRTIELLKNSNIQCIQGNYDYSVGNSEPECGCGYLDPVDRHFAQVSFDYTFKMTSEKHKPWLKSLPPQIELSWNENKILLCHGSPDETNEFVWESETSNKKIADWLGKYGVDGICATHSGLPWIRSVSDNGFWMNVGVLGRPAHEGKPHVYYATIALQEENLNPQLHKMNYNFKKVITEMRAEKLPEEFCRSLEEGIWTTCFNIMPPKERDPRSRT